jgi:hypothetical protein
VRVETIVRHANEVAERMAQSSWEAKPRSDRFRNEVQRQATDAAHVAAELAVLANDLRRAAAGVEHELATLKSLEQRVRNELDRLLKLDLPLPFVSPFDPTRLPSAGDPAWRNVAKLFGFKG